MDSKLRVGCQKDFQGLFVKLQSTASSVNFHRRRATTSVQTTLNRRVPQRTQSLLQIPRPARVEPMTVSWCKPTVAGSELLRFITVSLKLPFQQQTSSEKPPKVWQSCFAKRNSRPGFLLFVNNGLMLVFLCTGRWSVK